VTGTTLREVRGRLVRVPLGAARGGSGATELQVLHITVRDADGGEGTGFTYALTGGLGGARAVLEDVIAPRAAGLPLERWEREWRELWALTHRLGRGAALPALSAVDIAVWDLRARRAGLPLYRFLGAVHDTVPIYGSGRATHRMTTQELVDGALAYREEGYTAVKLRVGALGLEKDVERVRAVRSAAGPGLRLMVDCNERLDLASALWLSERLADLDVYWMEEPLVSDDVAGHATLARRSRVPVAVGEHLQGRYEFAAYVREGAAAVLQPDAPLTGGVSEWMRVAALADTFNLPVSPHFLPELHVHLAAAAPTATSVEHFPLLDDLLGEVLRPKDGAVAPPDRPGHGLVWDEEALRRHAAG
jgi:L-alanine-DL-glutamate epimerase-like enolase superfamily enzyme